MDSASTLGGDLMLPLCSKLAACKPKLQILAGLLLALIGSNARAELSVVIVEGLGGEAIYQKQFNKEAMAIQQASTRITNAERVQWLSGSAATRANIVAVMKQLATSLKEEDRLALYLIGHGSYDGYAYKFNLAGADLSGAELAGLLNAIKSGHQLVVVTGSSSGALQESLKKDSRIVVTATRSGNERNITQFGQYFADALIAANADVDKNGRINVQEAFDLATRKVKDYYESESRLATEHPLLSGTRAALFTIAQLVETQAELTTTDTAVLARREQLTNQIDELRLRKETLSEDMYMQQLEALLLLLAELDAGSDVGSANTIPEDTL
jgi:hypothetical protein